MLKPDDATIGILGGGQLGRMLALAAARLGFKCHIFSPSPVSPAFDVVHRVTCADYTDTGALDRFAQADDLKSVTAPPDFDSEPRHDLMQMLVKRAAQFHQSDVVRRSEQHVARHRT